MADMIAEQTTDDAQALKALLEYYRACGVDCAVEEAPRDRFADSARGAAKAPKRVEAPPPPSPKRARKKSAPPRRSFPMKRFAPPKTSHHQRKRWRNCARR